MDVELDWRGDEVNRVIVNGAVAGLNRSAVELQERTRSKTPVKTGALQQSIQVAEATSDHLEAIVFSDSPYAVYQHELFSYSRSNGQPKFLEAAAREFKNGFIKMVSDTLREYAR